MDATKTSMKGRQGVTGASHSINKLDEKEHGEESGEVSGNRKNGRRVGTK